MVAAFEGWNDAGEAASAVIDHLTDVWGATELVSLDSEEYYDFQVTRPQVTAVNGAHQGIHWPGVKVLLTRSPEGRDVVLVRGDEPSMRWRSEEHTSELQSRENLVYRLLLEQK